MTREQAIETIQEMFFYQQGRSPLSKDEMTACSMAIQALQAQADGDLISIKDVHSVLHNHMFDNAHRPSIYAELKRISKELDGLSVAIPNKTEIEAILQRFYNEEISCADMVQEMINLGFAIER